MQSDFFVQQSSKLRWTVWFCTFENMRRSYFKHEIVGLKECQCWIYTFVAYGNNIHK